MHRIGIARLDDLQRIEELLLEGIVTDRDIVVRGIARNRPVDRTPVSDVMSEDVQFARDTDTVQDAMRLMGDAQVRRVPVLDAEGRLVGIVALADRGQLLPSTCSTSSEVISNQNIFGLSIIVLVMTAGACLVMWFGELITERGIGNGMSLLIFAGIAARIPAEGKTIGLPYGVLVSCGNDGRGAVSAIERIASGYQWKAFAEPLIVRGDPDADHLAQARTLGETLAAGLSVGAF